LPPGASREICVGCRKPAGSGPTDKSLRIRSALIYEYPIDRVIAGAKFRQRLDFAAALGGLLGGYLCDPAILPASGLTGTNSGHWQSNTRLLLLTM